VFEKKRLLISTAFIGRFMFNFTIEDHDCFLSATYRAKYTVVVVGIL
jgi:hypothetical protein